MKFPVILIRYEISGSNRVEKAGIFKQNRYKTGIEESAVFSNKIGM